MTGWKIEPAKVQEVLNGMRPHITTLSEVITKDNLESIPEHLSPGTPYTMKAQAAMATLLGDQSDELNAITSSVGAGVQGVYNATIAYARGNEEMAATFQREMFKSASTGDFSYFEKYGEK